MTLQERLERWFNNHPDTWYPSGDIQRMIAEKTKFTPSNGTRRLREMAEDHFLEVEIRKSSGVSHAWYKKASQAIVEPVEGYLEGEQLQLALNAGEKWFNNVGKK